MNDQDAVVQSRLEPIVRLYMLGVDGDKDAVVEAQRRIERLRSDYPSHPLAMAYHGGINILIARDRTRPLDKLRRSKAGLKLLDEAVAAAPEDMMIRLIRGRCAFKLPDQYFGRAKTAVEDITYLLERHRRSGLDLKPAEIRQLENELAEAKQRAAKQGGSADELKPAALLVSAAVRAAEQTVANSIRRREKEEEKRRRKKKKKK